MPPSIRQGEGCSTIVSRVKKTRKAREGRIFSEKLKKVKVFAGVIRTEGWRAWNAPEKKTVLFSFFFEGRGFLGGVFFL